MQYIKQTYTRYIERLRELRRFSRLRAGSSYYELMQRTSFDLSVIRHPSEDLSTKCSEQ